MPLELYRERREARAEGKETRRRKLAAVAWTRLAVFAAFVALLWVVWETDRLGWPSVLVPVVVFAVLVVWHGRLGDAFRRAERAETFYARGLDRLEERWRGRGRSGERFNEAGHPYGRDLDVFGKASLFELLATTVSPWGEAKLAAWLKAPASPDVVRARQEAVRELAPRVDFREALASDVAPLDASLEHGVLAPWATAEPKLDRFWLRWVALGLGVLNLGLAVAWLASWTSRVPFLVVGATSAVLAMALRAGVQSVLEGIERPSGELAVLSSLLHWLESERFASPRLVALQEALLADGETASEQIRSASRLVDFLDARRNQLFAPVAALLLWGTQFAFALESWRRRVGPSIPGWLEAVGELDALIALSGYAYEHPDDPMPELVEDGAHFEARGLGHPLIPGDRLVRNDVELGGELRLLVVSGSNMSGKSTLLRAIGVNTVLALAGAPVRAGALRVSPLQAAASIRIEDSLEEGISHFYAEILRLRQVMELAGGETTVLFLLDEILHGTNSHDRRIGAEAVVRGLVERGAVGLITTHDLALSRLADTLDAKAKNVHFEDQIEDGKINFDYTMREGVVKKSNALELMRSIGLRV